MGRPKLVDAHFLKCSVAAIAILATVSYVCAEEERFRTRREVADTKAASDAAHQAMHLLRVASQDQSPTIRLQHLGSARAFLDAARTIAPDTRIERATRTHVRSLSQKIDLAIADAVAELDARMASASSSPAPSVAARAAAARRIPILTNATTS